jgi:phage host-nuclease inhibitor protein Gam
MNLREELTKLETRRVEIQAEYTRAQTHLSDAQKRLVEAPTDETVNALSSAQSRTSALKEAIVSLDAQITEARTRFDAAEQATKRAARTKRISQIAEAREQCVEDYNEAVALADELLREPLRLMHDAVTKRAALAREAAPLVAAENINANGHPAVEYTFKPAETPLAPAVRLAYEILDQQSGYVAAKRIEIEREAKRVVLPVLPQEPAPQTVEWVTNRVQGWIQR